MQPEQTFRGAEVGSKSYEIASLLGMDCDGLCACTKMLQPISIDAHLVPCTELLQ